MGEEDRGFLNGSTSTASCTAGRFTRLYLWAKSHLPNTS
jgi:hypothetical protein